MSKRTKDFLYQIGFEDGRIDTIKKMHRFLTTLLKSRSRVAAQKLKRSTPEVGMKTPLQFQKNGLGD